MGDPVNNITSILDKVKLTEEDRTEIRRLVKELNEADFNYIFEYAQSVLADRFDTNKDTEVISDIITDLQDPNALDKQPPPKLATMYTKINEEGTNEDNKLPTGVPANSRVGPNERFVPRTHRQSGYEQLPPKPMKNQKGTVPRGNSRKPLSSLRTAGGKRKKTRKTRRRR